MRLQWDKEGGKPGTLFCTHGSQGDTSDQVSHTLLTDIATSSSWSNQGAEGRKWGMGLGQGTQHLPSTFKVSLGLLGPVSPVSHSPFKTRCAGLNEGCRLPLENKCV